MAQFYEMPAISPTMELGTLLAWRLNEGDAFEAPAVVAEIATDKANMEAEIFEDGVLLKHLIAEGDEVPAGFPMAIWGESAGEDLTALLAEFEVRKAELAAGPPEAPEAPAAAPASATVVVSPPPPSAPVAPAREREWMGRKLPADFMDPPGDIRAGRTEKRIVASPLARAIAAERGLNLGRLRGSGPGGRIVRADVENATPSRGLAPAPADQVVRNTPMRKTIARRLLVSHSDIPSFFLTASFDMQGFVDLRRQLKAAEVRASYNDILIAAVARALRESPMVNASWSDQAITQHGRIDIGVAVALPDGLITPVLRSVDQKSIEQLATEGRELIGRAKEGKLQPAEYTGATFTVSNLGMMKIDHFTAIINPPEVAILAVGSIEQRPVVVDGALTVGWRMDVTMTCDHRVVDGAVGAAFLLRLRHYVESPILLLL